MASWWFKIAPQKQKLKKKKSESKANSHEDTASPLLPSCLPTEPLADVQPQLGSSDFPTQQTDVWDTGSCLPTPELQECGACWPSEIKNVPSHPGLGDAEIAGMGFVWLKWENEPAQGQTGVEGTGLPSIRGTMGLQTTSTPVFHGS